VSPRNWRFRLEDMDEALEAISEYVGDMDFAAWMDDRKTVDAVIRNLEIIGVTAAHIPDAN
jgi:uncharacterized protein with HEPN domain